MRAGLQLLAAQREQLFPAFLISLDSGSVHAAFPYFRRSAADSS